MKTVTNNERNAGRKPLGERRYVTVCGLTPEAAEYLDSVNKSALMSSLINAFVAKEMKTIQAIKKMELRE